MQNTNFIQNILDFSKAGFENACNSMATIQKKTEEVFDKNIPVVSYLPEEGRKLMKSWFKLASDTRDTVKQAVSTGHEQLESLVKSVSDLTAPRPETSRKTEDSKK